MRRRSRWWPAAALTLALVAVACGDDGEGDAAPGSDAPTTTVAAEPPLPLGEDPDPVVVGHRGAAGHHPDNSLEGFAAARDLGATWVELDVRLSADGEVVLSHDPETEQGTVVAAATAADLAGEGLVPLDEALDVIDEHALGVDVEIKALPWEDGFDPSLAMVDATVALLDDREPVGPVLVSSFNREALDRVRELAGDGYDTVLILPAGTAGADQAQGLVEREHDGVALEGPGLNAAEVAAFTDRDLPVWTWTIDDPDDAVALVDLGVTGVVTDLPDVISEALSA